MFNVRVISHSKPAIGVELKDDLLQMVAYCARVSNPNNQNSEGTSEKLVKYLIKHQHWSPLEMVSVCMEIETTRDIARQVLRHRSFSFQEFSQRYAKPEEMGEGWPFVVREARLQDTKNRQNSIVSDDELLQQNWIQQQKKVIATAQGAYKWAIDNGIAKEQARCVLPEGNTISRMYMNGTLRSWLHYIDLRRSNGTQQEHQEIAKACAEAIYQIFPLDDVI
jgi:thymidylate synthase (FAD)